MGWSLEVPGSRFKVRGSKFRRVDERDERVVFTALQLGTLNVEP
jgi:hypothetical protein